MIGVDMVIKQVVLSNEIICSGATINFVEEKNHYVVTNAFQKLNSITSKTLERYRKDIKTRFPNKVASYYVSIDGKFWYSRKILELRKYNKYKTESEHPTQVNPQNFKTQSLRSSLNDWITQKNWKYKCGANYKTYTSFESCSRKMEILFSRLCKKFKGAIISIFYVTEKNPDGEGYHNHFLINIDGIALQNKRRKVLQMIRSIGSDIPECELYNKTIGSEFVRYVTKYVVRDAESWFYLTNEY